jgi:hypothetical protein
MIRSLIAVVCACGVAISLAGCGQTDHMAKAKEQLVDISRVYLAKDHPDWSCQCDGEIVVVERVQCWEVHFPMRADNNSRTAVVRISKGTLQPMGLFHE